MSSIPKRPAPLRAAAQKRRWAKNKAEGGAAAAKLTAEFDERRKKYKTDTEAHGALYQTEPFRSISAEGLKQKLHRARRILKVK